MLGFCQITALLPCATDPGEKQGIKSLEAPRTAFFSPIIPLPFIRYDPYSEYFVHHFFASYIVYILVSKHECLAL